MKTIANYILRDRMFSHWKYGNRFVIKGGGAEAQVGAEVLGEGRRRYLMETISMAGVINSAGKDWSLVSVIDPIKR